MDGGANGAAWKSDSGAPDARLGWAASHRRFRRRFRSVRMTATTTMAAHRPTPMRIHQVSDFIRPGELDRRARQRRRQEGPQREGEGDAGVTYDGRCWGWRAGETGGGRGNGGGGAGEGRCQSGFGEPQSRAPQQPGIPTARRPRQGTHRHSYTHWAGRFPSPPPPPSPPAPPTATPARDAAAAAPRAPPPPPPATVAPVCCRRPCPSAQGGWRRPPHLPPPPPLHPRGQTPPQQPSLLLPQPPDARRPAVGLYPSRGAGRCGEHTASGGG